MPENGDIFPPVRWWPQPVHAGFPSPGDVIWRKNCQEGSEEKSLQPSLLLSEPCRFHSILCAQFLHGCGKMIPDGSL